MKLDDIKHAYSMREIVERYGYKPNRAGFISCPFHKGDNTASLKIYSDSYYCFGCGAHGDIFTFVQDMEQCDFKTAFYTLGGTYEKPSFSSRLAIYKSEKKKISLQKQELRMEEKRRLNLELIDIYRYFCERSEPLSDVWCDSYNALQYQLYLHGEMNEIPY